MYLIGETTAVDYVRLQHRPDRFQDRLLDMEDELLAAYAHRKSVPCGYFSFVIDTPERGRAQKDIRAKRFTDYLARRQVPIAPPYNRNYFGHDALHAIAYEDLFAMKPFADLVAGAAQFAFQSGNREDVITVPDALDNLSEYYLAITTEAEIHRDDVEEVRTHLERLAALCPGDTEPALEWLECGLGLSQAEARLWFNNGSSDYIGTVAAAGVITPATFYDLSPAR